jgi:hypothetical protein
MNIAIFVAEGKLAVVWRHAAVVVAFLRSTLLVGAGTMLVFRQAGSAGSDYLASIHPDDWAKLPR